MKVIVAGSRTINDTAEVSKAIENAKIKITEIISGNARGVDTLAENYASMKHIQFTAFPADWDKYGKPAGAIRNDQMAKQADALIAIWDGVSSGTKDMIKKMNKLGKPVFIYLVDNKNVR
jgi:glycerophosphoryl diester phosphodiesterase